MQWTRSIKYHKIKNVLKHINKDYCLEQHCVSDMVVAQKG